MLFTNDLILLLPELHWVCVMIAMLLFSTSLSSSTQTLLIARLGYIYLFFIACFIFLYLQLPSSEFTLFNYQYASDTLIFIVKLVFLALLAAVLYVSFQYFMVEKIFFVEYYFLIGLFCVSAFLLMAANDLVVFYLAIELQSLVLYTLAAIKRFNVFSTEAGLKYFVLGALSSGFLLFGISLFYGFSGTLNFFDIKFLLLSWVSTQTYFATSVGLVFFLSAILFKLAAAPFHVWTPDVYEGAPSPVVLIFATLPKLALFIFSMRLFTAFLYEYFSVWYSIFFFAGLLSVLLGTFAALNQLSIKRLYAYSAIVNVGYLVTALSYGTLSSFSATLNYLLIYLISTFSIFLVLLLFRTVFGLKKLKYLLDFKYFATYSSVFAIFFGLVFFSLAGVPPLAGFFIKFFLFKTIFVSDFMLNPAVFIILITSVISAFYYIRVIRFVFFDTKRAPSLFLPLNKATSLVFVLVVLFMLFFIFFQQLFLVSINVVLGTMFF